MNSPSPSKKRRETSAAEWLASLSASERARHLATASTATKGALKYDWSFWARPKQIAPKGNWQIWLLCTGRRFGKTRAAAEWCRARAEQYPGSRGVLVAPTPRDAIDVMVLGPSGILACCPEWNRPDYEPSKLSLTWNNGTIALIRSAFEPGSIRGLGCNWAWAEELRAWKKLPKKIDDELEARGDSPWHNLMFTLSDGEHPQVVVTTTPRPIPLMRAFFEEAESSSSRVVITTGNTYENINNLAKEYEEIIGRYKGTSLEAQEIYGRLLTESRRALWTRDVINRNRMPWTPDWEKRRKEFVRVVVAVDPSGGGDEIGIVACARSVDFQGYVLEDATLHGKPEEWASEAFRLYDKYEADCIIGERNFGGDMVESTIQAAAERQGRRVGYKDVIASRGKRVRAEPISLLDEKGVIHHVGAFPKMEDEMCTWEPDDPESPNRMDARVWSLTDLLLEGPYHEPDFDGVSFG